MKASRILGSLLSVGALALLAACGGGGGGGGTTPPVTNPGGGGGGSTPTPVPTATPTSSPTATPTPSGSGSLTVSSTVYNAYDGTSWGADNWQTNGVTTSDAGDGDAKANVGTGQKTDNLDACALNSESQMTSNNYHVHAFVGIYVNGSPMAIPDAIGMANPGGEPITTFDCAYSIHTHSASGIIHVEDPSITGTYINTQPPSQYNFQTLMDIWGQSLSGLAGGTGLPAIYVGTPGPTKTSSNEDLVNSCSLYTGSLSTLLLAHHTAIWLVYGAPPAGGVPQVAFGISN